MQRPVPSNLTSGLAAPAALAQSLPGVGADAALVLLDLDGFAAVNLKDGHEAGDRLLGTVVQALEQFGEARSGNSAVFWLTADEFAVVLDEVPDDEMLAQAHELCDVVRTASGLSAGCGAVVPRRDPTGSVDVRRTVRDAGLALRAARRAGRGSVSVLPDGAIALALAEEEDLEVRTLFRSGSFELHYQPLLEPSTLRPVGLEALVRARGVAGELLGPGSFLPQVRRSGFSVDLGTAVLGEALTTWHRRLRDEFPRLVDAGGQQPLLTVNIDGDQVEQDGFDALVLHLLDRADVSPQELVLEVPESVLGDAAACVRLQRLRDAGVQVAIDDFGAGPVVLGEIRDLPVDILKVDQVLVGRLDPMNPDMALIEDLQRLTRLLGLKLAVEAVEEAPLADRIATLGVALAQGYFYGRPVPADGVALWFRDRTSAQ